MNEKRIGIESRVEALRKQEASARPAVRVRPAGIDERLPQRATAIGAAEYPDASDTAQDSRMFLDAVTAELRSWEVYLERLQVRAAATSGSERDQAEAKISELRGHRNALSQRLDEVRSASGEEWRQGRTRVRAARDALERSAAETQAWFDQRGES